MWQTSLNGRWYRIYACLLEEDFLENLTDVFTRSNIIELEEALFLGIGECSEWKEASSEELPIRTSSWLSERQLDGVLWRWAVDLVLGMERRVRKLNGKRGFKQGVEEDEAIAVGRMGQKRRVVDIGKIMSQSDLWVMMVPPNPASRKAEL